LVWKRHIFICLIEFFFSSFAAFSPSELLAYRTEPFRIDTSKKSLFRQKICDLPKVRNGTRKSSVREKVDARLLVSSFCGLKKRMPAWGYTQEFMVCDYQFIVY
jgi:hypothetical protein